MLKNLLFCGGGEATLINVLKKPQNNPLRQHKRHSQILEVRHISISIVSAVLCSTDGYGSMIFAFSNPTPCFLTYKARPKAEIMLISLCTAGQCIDLSRWTYPKFIG
jgi:hypothetical protein